MRVLFILAFMLLPTVEASAHWGRYVRRRARFIQPRVVRRDAVFLRREFIVAPIPIRRPIRRPVRIEEFRAPGFYYYFPR